MATWVRFSQGVVFAKMQRARPRQVSSFTKKPRRRCACMDHRRGDKTMNTMKILYGVVGEGMGHAMRSRVLMEHLLAQGHTLRVVVSGRAYGFLCKALGAHPNVKIHEIHGFHLAFEENRMQLGRSVAENLKAAPRGIVKNVGVYQELQASGFRPDAVISDFESWSQLYARRHGIPLLSIDNQQAMTRCEHPTRLYEGKRFSALLAQTTARLKMPRAYHYLVTSFFFPPVRKERTSLLPPILRPEILAAKREPQEHVLVYQTKATNPAFLAALRELPYQFRIYGTQRDEQQDNLTLRSFSEKGFIEDLRTAKAILTNSGFSLLGEAVHLRIPALGVPIQGQFEQEINAMYLRELGYGDWCESLSPQAIGRFLKRVPLYERNLRRYTPRDNSMLFGCVDELLHQIALDEPAPTFLQSPAMGKFYAPLLPEERLFLPHAFAL